MGVPIGSFGDLFDYPNVSSKSWCFVILVNPNDLSRAGRSLLKNLTLIDETSGKIWDFFIPGFSSANKEKGMKVKTDEGFNSGHSLYPQNEIEYREYEAPYLNTRFYPTDFKIYMRRLGELKFDQNDFFDFYRHLEHWSNVHWRYSGECELLIFNLPENKEDFRIGQFFSYNLDDIIRNGNTISSFFNTITYQLELYKNRDMKAIKMMIDEVFYKLVVPLDNNNNQFFITCQKALESEYKKDEYVFISYSNFDFSFANEFRELLEENQQKCWMAPFGIPNGANYPFIIEHAIANCKKFILIFSETALYSVWVCKELLRAIKKFATLNPKRILVIWADKEFPRDGTQFALPLENIQCSIELERDINKNKDKIIELVNKE